MSAIDILARYALMRMDDSHLDEVLEIERMSYTNPWLEESFRHELEKNAFSRPRVAITLDEPRRVAGYCVSWIVFEQLHIQNVAVHPRHRRVGLARHLLHRALAEGMECGVRSAQLEVRRSNVVALKLYESLGFCEVGERKNYYSRPIEDAVLLRRELS